MVRAHPGGHSPLPHPRQNRIVFVDKNPDDVHGFLLHARWLEIFERGAAFLDRHLSR